MGTWCSRGILNLEESPSEESDALREAYRSLGLKEDIEPLQEQIDSLEAALQRTQQQLQVMSNENSQLTLLLRKQAEDVEAEQESSREKVCHSFYTAKKTAFYVTNFSLLINFYLYVYTDLSTIHM